MDYLNHGNLPMFFGKWLTETDLRKCFDPMICRGTLSRVAVLAEYPDHDIVYAFGIFNVAAAGKGSSLAPYVQRLATVIQMGEVMSLSQLCDHRQMAQRHDTWHQLVIQAKMSGSGRSCKDRC